jgi:hypothetical protein
MPAISVRDIEVKDDASCLCSDLVAGTQGHGCSGGAGQMLGTFGDGADGGLEIEPGSMNLGFFPGNGAESGCGMGGVGDA